MLCEKNIIMETGHPTTPSVALNRELTKWQEWRGVVFFILIVIGSSAAICRISAIQPSAPLILLAIGLFFDLVSLVARISTAVTGKYSSGFFIIGFAFYVWAWLSYPHPVLLDESGTLISLWMRKLPDIACLAVFHLAIHVSYGRDGDGGGTNATAEQGADGNPH